MGSYLTEQQANNLFAPKDHFSGPVPPLDPYDGQIWYDRAERSVKIFDAIASRWITLSEYPHHHRYFNRFTFTPDPSYNFVLASDADGNASWKSFAEIATVSGGYYANSPLQISGLDIRIAGVTTFGTPGQILQMNLDADGMEWNTITTDPAGSYGEVQFNDGTFSAESTFYWDKTDDYLAVPEIRDVTGSGLLLADDSGNQGITIQDGGQVSSNILTVNTSTAEALIIGNATDGVDYKIKFNGFSNQGTITWQEDENQFLIACDLSVDGEVNTASGIYKLNGTLGSASQVMAVNSLGTALEWVNQTGGVGGTTYSGITPIVVNNDADTISINGVTSFGTAGQVLVVNTGGTALEWADQSGSTYTGVTPIFVDSTLNTVSISGISSYGSSGQVLSVNATEDGLEWANLSGVSVAGAGVPLYNDEGTIRVSGISSFGNQGDILSVADDEASMEWTSKNYLDYKLKTTNYSITAGDMVIGADGSANTVDITLPTAIGKTGTFYTIKALDITNAVKVLTAGAQTIDGQALFTFTMQYQAISPMSNGSNWIIV